MEQGEGLTRYPCIMNSDFSAGAGHFSRSWKDRKEQSQILGPRQSHSLFYLFILWVCVGGITIGDQRRRLGILHYRSPPCSFETGSLTLNWSLTGSNWNKPINAPVFPQHSVGFTRGYAWLISREFRVSKLRSLCLFSKCCYPPNYLPSPTLLILMNS